MKKCYMQHASACKFVAPTEMGEKPVWLVYKRFVMYFCVIFGLQSFVGKTDILNVKPALEVRAQRDWKY